MKAFWRERGTGWGGSTPAAVSRAPSPRPPEPRGAVSPPFPGPSALSTTSHPTPRASAEGTTRPPERPGSVRQPWPCGRSPVAPAEGSSYATSSGHAPPILALVQACFQVTSLRRSHVATGNQTEWRKPHSCMGQGSCQWAPVESPAGGLGCCVGGGGLWPIQLPTIAAPSS